MKITNCPICNNTRFLSSDYALAPQESKWVYNCFKNKTLSTCLSCEFTFTAEIFDKGSLSKFYKSIYEGSKLQRFKSSKTYEFTSRFMSHVNFLKINIDLKDGMNILEIGPNENGMISTFKMFCTPNYYYYDQLEFPVINYFGGKRLGKYFSEKAALDLKSENKMDLIVLSHSFEHFEPNTLNHDVKTMKLALKPNGYVSIEVPLESLSEMHPPHTQFFNVKNMSLLFEKHGFEIVSTQSINSLIKKDIEGGIIKSLKSSKKLTSIIKSLLSIIIPRKIRMRLLMPIYEKNLKVLYEGEPYMRVLAKKVQ